MTELTIELIERTLEWKHENWPRFCCDVSAGILVNHLIEGTLMRGLYAGNIHRSSEFSSATNPFEHCWIELEDGRVLDPTRWTITCEEPYVYIDNNNIDYIDGIQWPEASIWVK